MKSTRKYVSTLLMAMSLLALDIALCNASVQSLKPELPAISYKIISYANNTMYRMNSDGSARETLFEKADVIDFRALSGDKILVLSSQYDGRSLEIFNVPDKIWMLVEFTEGDIPNIAISNDGSTIAYEIRHFPISIQGDGIWIYDTTGKKTHAKISGTALTIESININAGRLYILFHELDLISDDTGLFIETVALDGSFKTRRNRVAEGLKMLLDGGYSLGFIYPTSGKKIELKDLSDNSSFTTELPSGNIILFNNSYFPGESSLLVFERQSLDFSGVESTEILIWDLDTNKMNPLKINELTNARTFRWSPDGHLYFTAQYSDPSGEKSSPMIFRMDLSKEKFELISVTGGLFDFQMQ